MPDHQPRGLNKERSDAAPWPDAKLASLLSDADQLSRKMKAAVQVAIATEIVGRDLFIRLAARHAAPDGE
jgi:hypothetical protein